MSDGIQQDVESAADSERAANNTPLSSPKLQGGRTLVERVKEADRLHRWRLWIEDPNSKWEEMPEGPPPAGIEIVRDPPPPQGRGGRAPSSSPGGPAGMRGAQNDRMRVERMDTRETFTLEIESAGEKDGKYRIRGTMNSFQVTDSGRLLHPDGYQEFLRANPRAQAPMLANHGEDQSGYASVGIWDRLEMADGKMRWSGWVGQGTKLTDETRTLVAQGILTQLSLGWKSREKQWASLSDRGLDRFTRSALESAGAKEALVHRRYLPREGSLVDVADDQGARIAAGSVRDVAAVLARLDEIEQMIGGRELPDGIEQMIQRIWDEGENRLVETLEGILSDPRSDYARALLSQADGDGQRACGHGQRVRNDTKSAARGLARMRAKLAAWGEGPVKV